MTEPQPDALHVAPALRGFGLGFGAHHQVPYYTESGPKTGPLLRAVQCETVASWAREEFFQGPLTDHLSPEALWPGLQNRLLHADPIELVRLLPHLLAHLPPRNRAALFLAPLSRIAPGVWAEFAETRPALQADGLNSAHPADYFVRLLDRNLDVQATGSDVAVNGVSLEAVAILLPILFEAMDAPARHGVVRAFAEALHAAGEDKAFFGPLADPDLNRLVIEDGRIGDCTDIINNGRTLMMRSDQGPVVRFQGETYRTSNLHFHPLRNVDPGRPLTNHAGERDDKAEFAGYKNPRHEAQCRADPRRDPNKGKVAQLHSIHTSVDAQGRKRALLLGADVVLGAHNEAIEPYIQHLRIHLGPDPLPIIADAGNAADVAEKAVPAAGVRFNPLAAFAGAGRFDMDGLPEAPFLSLHLGGMQADSPEDVTLGTGKSEVFYRGVRVIHLPDPVTISPQQFAALRAFQPELRKVDEVTCVHPRPRFQPPKQRWLEVAQPGARDAFVRR